MLMTPYFCQELDWKDVWSLLFCWCLVTHFHAQVSLDENTLLGIRIVKAKFLFSHPSF